MKRPLLLLCIVGVLKALRVHYDRNTVYRVTPRAKGEFHHLLEYQHYLQRNRVDIWRETSGPDSPLDFRVRPDNTEVMKNLNLKFTALIPDVETLIQNTMKNNVKSRDGNFDYGVYHNLSEIMDWMNSTVSQYSDMANIFPIAKSFEGRQLNGIKISVSPRPGKAAVWLEGGIHAREWISPATVIYMTIQLLGQYGKDPDVTSALNAFDVYIVPVFNVDGYEYTWTTERMWRKNRSKHPGSTCVGVDPNRNWDFHWSGSGGSKDPCSDNYCGPFPFSESVVMGVSDSIRHIPYLVGFIDFHSYSQLWMTPWGYTRKLPKDAVQQNQSSAAAVAAIEKVHGTKYTCGTIGNIAFSIASGNSVDWTYGVLGVKYSAGVELRDNGTYGFLLPPDQIIPSGQETIRGLLAYMDFIKNNM